MINQAPLWETVMYLQQKLQASNSQKLDIFFNSACNFVLDLIESDSPEIDKVILTKRYMAAGLVAVRTATRRQLISDAHQPTLEYIYYGSYIDADTILAKSAIRTEILKKFSGENRKILEGLFDGLSQKQIANDLGLTYSGVRQRISRFRASPII